MKIYQCICGKVFDDPQKFNGHKQGCKEHIVNKLCIRAIGEPFSLRARNERARASLAQMVEQRTSNA